MKNNKPEKVFEISDLFLIVFAIIAILLFSSVSVYPQNLSRWALGRPSLLIDLPGKPNASGVAWAERPMYSYFPNAWSAEENGLRVEIARIYTTKTPSEVLAEVGQKIKIPLSVKSSGEISGRETVNYFDLSRMITVIGKDSEFFGGATWVVMATFQGENGLNVAYRVFDSILVEREGGRKWALRSFGNTSLIAELPFEMLPTKRARDTNRMRRYELNFDGMSVTVLNQTADENMFFKPDDVIKKLIEDNRAAPGTTDFTSSVGKTKLGDKTAELITMDFKQGYRNYRIYQLAHIEKHRSLLASIKIDPNRADHQKTAEKILRSLRFSNTSIYGWKSYAVGKNGLFVDLPKPPGAPFQQNAVTVYNIESPLSSVEIRELEVSYTGGHNPDFSAKNYFEIQNALSKIKFELTGIESRLVDGLEARLIKATWKNGKITNQRQILMILGYETQWIVDVIAAPETVDYLDKVMQSVRVEIPAPGNSRRQFFGKTGVSFLADQSEKQIPLKTEEKANDPDFVSEITGFGESGSVMIVFYEATSRTNLPISKDLGVFIVNSFARGFSETNQTKITAALRNDFPAEIDGIEGFHLIFDFKSGNNQNAPPVQGDLIMLSQDKQTVALLVITNYGSGKDALYDRARILNSLRVGL